VWAKPVVSPDTTRMPAPRSRPELSSSTRPVVEHRAGGAPILDEHLGEVAAGALTVTEADTAISMLSGEVPVLATPRLVALFEETAMKAIEGQLPDTETTVGMRVQVDHLAPTAVGDAVTAEATLDKIEGRRLVFTVSARDARGLVGAGKVTRVVVQIERFLDKLN
jgi:fluoroacetyl-CoA thioesterase